MLPKNYSECLFQGNFTKGANAHATAEKICCHAVRNRVERIDSPAAVAADPGYGNDETDCGAMVRGAESASHAGELAFHDERCPNQIKAALPLTAILKEH